MTSCLPGHVPLMSQNVEIPGEIAMFIRWGARTPRTRPAAPPTAGTNSPSSIVYNCSTVALKGSGTHAPSRHEGAADQASAHWVAAKILSSGADAETEPKMPPWALIMARPIS